MERRRDFGIDALRIISALMVIGTHVLNSGGALAAAQNTANAPLALLLRILCLSAVNCFALISGYFMCLSRFRLSKLLNLWAQVVFYALVFTLLHRLISPGTLTAEMVISAFLPITFKRLWYISAYFALFLLSPFVNRLLRSLDRKMHLALALLMLLLFSAIPTFSLFEPFGDHRAGYSTVWLLTLYILGAYLRKYEVNFSPRALALTLAGAIALTAAVRAFVRFRPDWLLRNISPTMVAISSAIFLLLKGLAPKGAGMRKAIAAITPLAFASYVIHLQPLVAINLGGSFGWLGRMHPLAFPFALVATVLAIFLPCIAVDFLRGKLFALLGVDRALCAIEERTMRAARKIL